MRVAIFGSGGVGGYYGARLAQSGNDVAFIARGDHLAALQRRGLTVESIAGDVHLDRVRASHDPGEIGEVDLVIVATKTHQLAEAARQMLPLLGAETRVLPLLNGVEAPRQLAAALPRGRVLVGLTRIFSFIAEPGVIRHIGAEPYIALGSLDPADTDSAAEGVLAALRGAGITSEMPSDIEAALWRKFQVVVSLGGIGSVTRAPVGVFRSQPESRALLESALHEIHEVAHARGIGLPAAAAGEALAFIDGLPPQSTTSLQRDLAEGRPSEFDAWTGAVVRLASEVAVDTPVHRFVYASLLPSERRARGELDF